MTGKVDIDFGIQFGDEGKGKLVDILLNLGRHYVNFRFQGADNAGHTLYYRNKKVALHQIPSGIFHPKIKLRTGSGSLISPRKINSEIEEVLSAGATLTDRYSISSLVSIIQPGYILQDKFQGAKIGTTGNGIGPTYAARATRHDGEMVVDLRFGQVLEDPTLAREIMSYTLEKAIQQIGGRAIAHSRYPEFTDFTIIDAFLQAILDLEPFLERDPLWFTQEIESGKNALGEGAQGGNLCVIYGIPPYNTSSVTGPDAAFTGGDISSRYRGTVYGVAKAIMSRVGNGPFVSEWGGAASEAYCNEDRGFAHTREKERDAHGDPIRLIQSGDPLLTGIGLRMLSEEYGASTGRPRRIGKFDTAQLRHSIRRNGVDGIFINKVDDFVLYAHTPEKKIPVTIGYQLDDQQIDFVPTTENTMRRVKPIDTYIPAFDRDIRDARKPNELPSAVHQFVELVESETGCPVLGVGVGPKSDEYVLLKEL